MTPLERATALQLWGLVANWEAVRHEPWLPQLLDWSEQERQRRSLARRLEKARLTKFKPLADFDWAWPERIDREAVEELFTFAFLDEAVNVVLLGPNGVGKSMIASNLAHAALLAGHSARFTTASAMLAELDACESTSALKRALLRYTSPKLLVIDEVGYLSYANRHADLLFEVISHRYEKRSTIVTTNRPFEEWRQVFPNAPTVVTLVDRLTHRSEILTIEGGSYRAKEATEAAAAKRKRRKQAAE